MPLIPKLGDFDSGLINSGTGPLDLVLEVFEPEEVLVLHVVTAAEDGGAAPAPTISDTLGLTWTQRGEYTWVMNGENARMRILWAVAPAPGRYTVSVSLDRAGSAPMGVSCWRNVDHLSPWDENGSLPASATHSTSAQPSVTGVSTDEDEVAVLTFAGSLNNPGDPSGYTQIFAESAFGVDPDAVMHYQIISSALSGATVTWSSSVADAYAVVDALRPPRKPRARVRFFDGFDLWDDYQQFASVNPIGTGMFDTSNNSFVTGRHGSGQAFRCGTTLFAEHRRVYYDTTCRAKPDECEDGDLWAVGAAINLGASDVDLGTDNPQYVINFHSNVTTRRFMVAFASDTHRWEIWTGDGLPAGTRVDEGPDPTVDPYQTWVCVEVEVYRHATDGFIRVWQERAGYTWDVPPYHAGPIPLNGVYVPGSYQMELVAEYLGDTSVSTLGTIDGFSIGGSRRIGSSRMGNDFDDLYFATGGRIGTPWRVVSQAPTSDESVSGWSPSTGADLYAVADDVPVVLTDYFSANTGNPEALLGFPALPYTPQKIYGVGAIAVVATASGSVNDADMDAKSGSDELLPPWVQSSLTDTDESHMACFMAKDPSTEDKWTKAGAEAAQFGPYAAGNSFSSECRVYDVARLALVTIDSGPPIEEIGVSQDDPSLHPIDHGFDGFSSGLQPLDDGVA